MSYPWQEITVIQMPYKGRNIIIIKHEGEIWRPEVFVTYSEAKEPVNYVLPSFKSTEHAMKYIEENLK